MAGKIVKLWYDRKSEKFEDLQDIGFIKRIKETRRENYLTAAELDAVFDKKN